MQKNNAALLYVLAKVVCELCALRNTLKDKRYPCSKCEFQSDLRCYKKLAESEL